MKTSKIIERKLHAYSTEQCIDLFVNLLGVHQPSKQNYRSLQEALKSKNRMRLFVEYCTICKPKYKADFKIIWQLVERVTPNWNDLNIENHPIIDKTLQKAIQTRVINTAWHKN